jgi:hypothetical protein
MAAPPVTAGRTLRPMPRSNFEEPVAIDFFGARGRAAAERALRSAEVSVPAPPSDGDPATTKPARRPRAHTWVTRRDVHIDRVTSAWLIRRFIDPAARFKFVASRGYKPLTGEARFDMYEAEFTHEGEHCTFETLVARFGLDDPALRILGEIVHDIDFKQEVFGHGETAGLQRLVAEVARVTDDDARRIAIVGAALDALYLALSTADRPAVRAAAAERGAGSSTSRVDAKRRPRHARPRRSRSRAATK